MTDVGTSGDALKSIDVDHGEAVPPEASGSVALVGLVFAATLLVLAPFATRAQPADKAWFVAPINAPVVALLIMAIPSAFLTWRWLRAYRGTHNPRLYLLRSRWAFSDLPGAIEYCIYFCVYLWLISLAGFALSTLAFGQWCLFRSGLRGPKWIAANLAFASVLVILLRVVLGLWFPMAPVFKLLPSGIGNVLGAIL